MDSLRDVYNYYYSVTGESYIKTTCLNKSEAFNPKNIKVNMKDSFIVDSSLRSFDEYWIPVEGGSGIRTFVVDLKDKSPECAEKFLNQIKSAFKEKDERKWQ